ncbi:MAG: DUF2236 domain-containing protein [Acidobacteria bacterium]|nr:DUF2236 domain-containing protein [Acidobacteriota bacterium]
MFSAQSLTDRFLDEMRQTTDPIADNAVLSALDTGVMGEWKINQLLDQLISNGTPEPAGLPEPLLRYFEETDILPPWADRKKIRAGEVFFEDAGFECVTVLFCKSLPECYAAYRGAEVLFRTGRLLEKGTNIEPLARRIVETAQFLLNVMAPGGLTSDKGCGRITAQKVRLIHASIRHFLKQQGWDEAQYGQPINQEDMAGTLLAFGLETLEGLALLKIPVSESDQEAYLHAWNVVGSIMGIDDRLLAPDMPSARALWARIRERQFGPSEQGQALTQSLIDFIDYEIPHALKGMPLFLMHQMMDAEMLEWLAVPPVHNWLDRILTDALKVLFGIETKLEVNHPGFRKAVGLFSEKLLQNLVVTWNGEKNVAFEIPPSLKGNWPSLDPSGSNR